MKVNDGVEGQEGPLPVFVAAGLLRGGEGRGGV